MKSAFLLLCLGLAASPVGVLAQDQAVAGSAAAGPAAVVEAPPSTPATPTYDEDLDFDPAEPDFTVIDLPTNLRLPRHKLAFRLTHRFARGLSAGSFSDLASDFFGFDGGAQIGFGLRFGLLPGTQIGVYRTSDRTLEFFAQRQILRQGKRPVGLSVVAAVEGLDNFSEEYSPSVGLVLSRSLGGRGAVYLEPSWVGNTRINPSAPGTADGTVVLGLGARLRVTKTMSLIGEIHPRLAGYRGDLGSGDPKSLATMGLEWRVGGHAFQLNFSNTQGTTPAQVARGQQGLRDWFIGFNLTRKFY